MLSCSFQDQIFDRLGEEGLKRGGGDRNGNVYAFTRDARKMFSEMRSNPDFVPFDDLPEGVLFGGYTKSKKSQSNDVGEVGEITGIVGVAVGGDFSQSDAMDDGGTAGVVGGNQVPPKPVQDPPIEHALNLSLEELFSGCTKRMKISRNVLSANGSVSREDKILSIEVKQGWKQGTKVTFPREGDHAVGRIPSNIVFVISEKPHSKFKREGNNLRHRADITLKTAICGGEVEISHIDGLVMQYSLRSVVKPDHEEMYRGLGMPISKQPGKSGDLLVNYNIRFPEEILGNDKENLANILEKYH